MPGNTSENKGLAKVIPTRSGPGLEHLWLPYAQMKTMPLPLSVKATHGCRIILADGRELIDGIASWWTACHGYNHSHIREAVEHQLATMPHVMFGGLVHEQALTLARRLAGLLGPGKLDRVFFSESGSVAVEVALKMALQYWCNRGIFGRDRIIAFKGGYHGDTSGAMAISDAEGGFHGTLSGALPQQIIIDLPVDEASTAALETVLAQHSEHIAAIIVEPLVQGAGGMRFHDAQVLQTLRTLADRYGLLLIFDEIFTGFGRTGTMFWSDDAAKALMHGPTFMANALGCAAANASLDLFAREPRLGQVAKIEALLRAGLEPCRKLAGVKEVRVKGGIGVVELDRIENINKLRQRFIDEGVFVRPFGSIVYLTPAFTIAEEDLARLTSTVARVLA